MPNEPNRNITKSNWLEQLREKFPESIIEDIDLEQIRDRDNACTICLEPFSQEEKFDESKTEIYYTVPLYQGGNRTYENCSLVHTTCRLNKVVIEPA